MHLYPLSTLSPSLSLTHTYSLSHLLSLLLILFVFYILFCLLLNFQSLLVFLVSINSLMFFSLSLEYSYLLSLFLDFLRILMPHSLHPLPFYSLSDPFYKLTYTLFFSYPLFFFSCLSSNSPPACLFVVFCIRNILCFRPTCIWPWKRNFHSFASLYIIGLCSLIEFFSPKYIFASSQSQIRGFCNCLIFPIFVLLFDAMEERGGASIYRAAQKA